MMIIDSPFNKMPAQTGILLVRPAWEQREALTKGKEEDK